MINILKWIPVTGLLLLTGCTVAKKSSNAVPSLKEVFKDDFLIGTAMNADQIQVKDKRADSLIRNHFNGVTAEDIMKAETLQPEWGRYHFELADQLMDYANKNGLKVNGHTLIWHSQLPAFMKTMQNADSVRLFFNNHINTVAGRYKDKVYSWDVVNEALNDDGSLRKSVFLDKMGEDYIVEAFRLAQKAAPAAKLYYNDYNIEQPKKRAGVIALVKKIQAAGIRIDGVGIQGHWKAGNVPLTDIEESIKAFAALGMEVMITELDLGVLPNPWEGNTADVNARATGDARMNPYTTGLPDSVQQVFTKSYEELFRLFVQYKKNISRITFWGVYDGQSWLNNWPINGRTNYPLLFDRNYEPKPAFFKVVSPRR